MFDRKKIALGLSQKRQSQLVKPDIFLKAKFEESNLKLISRELRGESDALRAEAHQEYNYKNQNTSTIKDYLFPEVRAQEDRRAGRSTKDGIAIEKLAGRKNVMNNRLYELLKDKYHN